QHVDAIPSGPRAEVPSESAHSTCETPGMDGRPGPYRIFRGSFWSPRPGARFRRGRYCAHPHSLQGPRVAATTACCRLLWPHPHARSAFVRAVTASAELGADELADLLPVHGLPAEARHD